jgi:hypothetical protein
MSWTLQFRLSCLYHIYHHSYRTSFNKKLVAVEYEGSQVLGYSSQVFVIAELVQN